MLGTAVVTEYRHGTAEGSAGSDVPEATDSADLYSIKLPAITAGNLGKEIYGGTAVPAVFLSF
jgi:hypothetical protein